MPSNYCLHCTKETQQKCACCSSSYYCSHECQKADWNAIHRYESVVYNLGVSSTDDTPTDEPANRQTLTKEISRERNEYNELISKTMKALEKQPRAKREMNMTHQQRKQMQLSLGGVTPNPVKRKEEERARFLDQVVGMVSHIKEMPIANDGGKLIHRPLVVDEEAEQAISLLFRKYDLLHIKVTYALVTKKVEDAAEVARYRDYVESTGRRIIHQILMGSQEDYERVLEFQQIALRDAMIETMVDKLVADAEEEVVNECVSYIRDTATTTTYGQPFGKTTNGDDEIRRENTRNAINDDKPEERKTIFSMDQYDSMANVAMGVAEAAQNQMEEDGKIDHQQRDNTIDFIHNLWPSLRKRIEEVATSTRQKGSKFFERVWNEIATRVGQVKEDIKEKLRNASVARMFCVASTVGFLLITYGLYTYSFSPFQSLNEVEKNIDDAVSLNNAAVNGANVMTSQIMEERVRLDSLTKVLTESSADSYNFMAIDPVNDDLDLYKNKILIDTTLGNMVKKLVSVEEKRSSLTGRVYGWFKGRDAFIEHANVLLENKSLYERRVALEEIKFTITSDLEFYESQGLSVGAQQVKNIIDGQRDFVDKMGVGVSDLSSILDKQKQSLEDANVNLFNVREKVRNTSTGAPFLMTMLKRVGMEYYLDPTLIHVMGDVAASHFSYELFNAQIQSGLYKMGQIESHMHKLFEAKGVFTKTSSQFEWLWSVGTSVVTMDFAYIFFHTLSCIMLVHNFLSPILKQQWVSSTFQYIGNIIGSGLNMTGIPDILGYSPGKGDSERLRELRDNLLKKQGSVEKTVQHALKLFNNQELSAVDYGVLIQLLYRNEEVNAGNVVVNRITAMGKNWFDMGVLPTYYLSRVIGYQYIYAQYTKFFWQIFYIVQYVWSCLSWGHLSLIYGVVVIVLSILNRTASVVGIGEKRETVLSHLLAPFTTLFRLIHKHTYTSMIIVSLIYQTIYYIDASSNLLGKVEDISSKAMGLNTEKEKIWEREEVKREVEKVLDQGHSFPLPDTMLDKGAITIIKEMSLLAKGSPEDIAELSTKYENLINVY